MDRRMLLHVSGVALMALTLPAGIRESKAALPESPDVLLITIEDLQTCFGCYGHSICKTPNLDAFASRAVRFDNAQCQYPVCNPSRSSMLSGLRPRTTGILGNSIDWNDRLGPGTTMPEFFRAGGYDAVTVGKIFHHGNQGRVYDATSRWTRIIQEGDNLSAGFGGNRESPPPRILYDHLTDEERAKEYTSRAWTWRPLEVEDIQTGDGKIGEQAVRVLSKKRRPDDKPLLLAVGFHKPHLSLDAPRKYFDMYPPESIPLPDYAEDELDDVPTSFGLGDHKVFTDEKRREAIAAYYACVTFVDAQIGRIFDAMKRSGRDKDTIVIIWGDHGFHIGEHMLWQKSTLFEESCRVPFVISVPGVTPAGAVCRRPVESIDFLPTFAELCGLDLPEGLECISMVPLLEDPTRPWKKAAFTVTGNGVSIRTERYRYTEWRGNPKLAELYDHQTDPREITNLATSAAHAETVAELSRLLNAGWKACLPDSGS